MSLFYILVSVLVVLFIVTVYAHWTFSKNKKVLNRWMFGVSALEIAVGLTVFVTFVLSFAIGEYFAFSAPIVGVLGFFVTILSFISALIFHGLLLRKLYGDQYQIDAKRQHKVIPTRTKIVFLIIVLAGFFYFFFYLGTSSSYLNEQIFTPFMRMVTVKTNSLWLAELEETDTVRDSLYYKIAKNEDDPSICLRSKYGISNCVFGIDPKYITQVTKKFEGRCSNDNQYDYTCVGYTLVDGGHFEETIHCQSLMRPSLDSTMRVKQDILRSICHSN